MTSKSFIFHITKEVFLISDFTESYAPFGPCSSSPCMGGGTCEEHDGTFTCFCSRDRTGDRCERELTNDDVNIPSFDGAGSYIKLKSMHNVEHKFGLEVEFMAYGLDGCIVFAGSEDSDFISLRLSHGYISLANSVTHQVQRQSRSIVCFEILYACTHVRSYKRTNTDGHYQQKLTTT